MITPDNLAEEQLQQELREMFLVDTRQQLETYFDLAQQLQPQSWIADIQHIYRTIHTIKGGAVTVEANEMLHAATVLEDLLSDLRYLEISPPLSDGQLSNLLQEAGELLASCLEIASTDHTAIDRVQLTIQRLTNIHVQVKERYLPDWNEMRQVHQEFAEQGFDLVILELEMSLNQLPPTGSISGDVIAIGNSMLQQLRQIGQDLELAPGWTTLLEQGQVIIESGECAQWRSCLPDFFVTLKQCAKNSGEISSVTVAEHSPAPVPPTINPGLELDPAVAQSIFSDFEDFSNLLTDIDLAEKLVSNEAVASSLDISVLDSLEIFPVHGSLPLDDDLVIPAFDLEKDGEDSDLFAKEMRAMIPKVSDGYTDSAIPGALLDLTADNSWDNLVTVDEGFLGEQGIDDSLLIVESQNIAANPSVQDPVPDLEIPQHPDLRQVGDDYTENDLSTLIDDFFGESDFHTLDIELDDNGELPADLEPAPFPATGSPEQPDQMLSELVLDKSADIRRTVQIPVPLERLDRSAQQVVDTLLTTRGVTSQSQKLRTQLMQLTTLTAESAQFTTKLRQLQDDYALLRNISDEQESANNLTLERYRQGYTTINRLLENILRMSELGREIETSTRQTFDGLTHLDQQILSLKDGIELNRLVPFRNLTLRARAILRDLTNRYGKPVDLIVKNEQIELDAGVIQQLEPALLHLLRNAYDHGIEAADERLAAGKAVHGQVILALQRRGNVYRLTIQDDGKGMDAALISAQAQARGFTRTTIKSNEELLKVICQPGFSSRASVSEISGRGVGMDVVASQIAAIGGKLLLDTQVGVGSTFTIEVPAPQLLVSCVLLQTGERIIALPTEEILETVLLSSTDCQYDNDRHYWQVSNARGVFPGFNLSSYWQSVSSSLPETAIGLRCRLDGQQTVWLIADGLLEQADLLINSLPSPLVSPAGMLGVSLQPDGHLISVLEPNTLATVLQKRSTMPLSPSSAMPSPGITTQSTTILIVDDAALMRRRLMGSLGNAGFAVQACGDGLEALQWLQNNELPALMITDVEMPNMDGLTLIDRCRKMDIQIPILVLSSRLSEDWGKEAQRVGANEFLNKGFTTDELLKIVEDLLATPAIN